ncbi:MAG: tripartite tricarboxylate transporter substrate binding protein [Gracilibacteraceae bacterium]|jgi:putative tricarboxylic transport membrane protein|nr:tripartite tricarboxylate transporter substrate binding protein [Gracilibacteraceae bacterium]
MKTTLLSLCALCALCACAPVAAPAAWAPGETVTFYVPADPGGGLDTLAHALSPLLTAEAGLRADVRNRPGGWRGQAAGTVEFTARFARRDDVLLVASTPLVMNHARVQSPGPEDLRPLALLGEDYGLIAVSAASPYDSLDELLAALKNDPAAVRFCGGGAAGAWVHLNAALLARTAGADPAALPYTALADTGAAVEELHCGAADALTADIASLRPWLQTGELRLLGVSAPARLTEDAALRDTPTYREQGLDLVLSNWRGVFAGLKMSAAAQIYWENLLAELCAAEEWRAALAAEDIYPVYAGAADFAARLRAETALYEDVFRLLPEEQAPLISAAPGC